MKRVALIDLGSNSVRFVISEITDSGSYRLVYQQKESIRLSEGMWTHQMLTKPAIERAIKTLKALSHMAKAMGIALFVVYMQKQGFLYVPLVERRRRT